MDFSARFRSSGSQPRRVTVTISLTHGDPCQFRDLMDGEKFFSGPYLLCKLDWHRAAELAVDEAMVWEGIAPTALVYRAELGTGTQQSATDVLLQAVEDFEPSDGRA